VVVVDGEAAAAANGQSARGNGRPARGYGRAAQGVDRDEEIADPTPNESAEHAQGEGAERAADQG
jgi:hypothetical protein